MGHEVRAVQLMELIARARWREAVTYRDTWPHEYVLIKKDEQRELLAAFCARIASGEGVEGRFFSKTPTYLSGLRCATGRSGYGRWLSDIVLIVVRRCS